MHAGRLVAIRNRGSKDQERGCGSGTAYGNLTARMRFLLSSAGAAAVAKRKKARFEKDAETPSRRLSRERKQKRDLKNLRKNNRAKKVCPAHGVKLIHGSTGWWCCPVDRCNVGCGSGITTAPADPETRALRGAVHQIFDPLWEDQFGPFVPASKSNSRKHRRNAAYNWLKKNMNLRRSTCHVGMFDREQCLRAIALLKNLRDGC